MTAPALEFRHVSKRYSSAVLALDDVSLVIPKQAFTLLTGASGSGKTTLLTLSGARDRLSSGTVLVLGEDLSRLWDVGLTQIRRRIGFVAQDFAAIPGLPAWENVTYPLIPQGVTRADRRRIAAELLDRLSLGGLSGKKPDAMSGGELQRVAVARALAVRPEIILADEPTSNLDEDASRLVIALFQERHTAGSTLIVSSHDSRWAPCATQTIVLTRGKVANC
jgi:putative ABC transport system ATP-binding protein